MPTAARPEVRGEDKSTLRSWVRASGSWLNMVEIFFGIITRQAIRRGSFNFVRELIEAIRRFIDSWNERCAPFIWTKDADTVLAKAQRQETSDTNH